MRRTVPGYFHPPLPTPTRQERARREPRLRGSFLFLSLPNAISVSGPLDRAETRPRAEW